MAKHTAIEVKNKTKQVKIYKVLRTLLVEQDVKAFSRMFDNAINGIAIVDETINFSNYFTSYYASSVQSRAYCHRIHTKIKTNAYCCILKECTGLSRQKGEAT